MPFEAVELRQAPVKSVVYEEGPDWQRQHEQGIKQGLLSSGATLEFGGEVGQSEDDHP